MKTTLHSIEILVALGLLVLNALSNLLGGRTSSYFGIVGTIVAVVIIHDYAVFVSDIRHRYDRYWREDWK